jgi:catechol 2,3-dioxygenase-like lactoylglutathione lyase family enzyme
VFDHVGIAVSDLAASERFYRTVLSVLGVEPSHADAELVGELAQYEDKYRLCYVRGPEGSSSGSPSRSASGLNFRDGRAPQASFPNAGPAERRLACA